MGIFGEILGESAGKALGQYGFGDSGRDIGGQIGKFAGSFLPFKKGGRVKRRKMRKGGMVGDESVAPAEMKMGGRVAKHTKMADGGIVAGQFVPAIHMVASAKPAMGVQVPPPEVLGFKPLYLMS